MVYSSKNQFISTKLNKSDKAILNSLGTVVDGVAKIFGSNCEVVLHSLEDMSRSIINIANGHVTGRKIGSPLTDFAIEMMAKANSSENDVTESYYSKTEDGKFLKSVTMLIRNLQGKPIGVLCINIDLSAPFVDVIKEMLSTSPELPSGKAIEHFSSTTKDLIHNMLGIAIDEINRSNEIPVSEKGKAIVAELYKKGIFNIKGALDLVAKEIGVSRYTVYNYIREAKADIEAGK